MLQRFYNLSNNKTQQVHTTEKQRTYNREHGEDKATVTLFGIVSSSFRTPTVVVKCLIDIMSEVMSLEEGCEG